MHNIYCCCAPPNVARPERVSRQDQDESERCGGAQTGLNVAASSRMTEVREAGGIEREPLPAVPSSRPVPAAAPSPLLFLIFFLFWSYVPSSCLGPAERVGGWPMAAWDAAPLSCSAFFPPGRTPSRPPPQTSSPHYGVRLREMCVKLTGLPPRQPSQAGAFCTCRTPCRISQHCPRARELEVIGSSNCGRRWNLPNRAESARSMGPAVSFLWPHRHLSLPISLLPTPCHISLSFFCNHPHRSNPYAETPPPALSASPSPPVLLHASATSVPPTDPSQPKRGRAVGRFYKFLYCLLRRRLLFASRLASLLRVESSFSLQPDITLIWLCHTHPPAVSPTTCPTLRPPPFPRAASPPGGGNKQEIYCE